METIGVAYNNAGQTRWKIQQILLCFLFYIIMITWISEVSYCWQWDKLVKESWNGTFFLKFNFIHVATFIDKGENMKHTSKSYPQVCLTLTLKQWKHDITVYEFFFSSFWFYIFFILNVLKFSEYYLLWKDVVKTFLNHKI